MPHGIVSLKATVRIDPAVFCLIVWEGLEGPLAMPDNYRIDQISYFLSDHSPGCVLPHRFAFHPFAERDTKACLLEDASEPSLDTICHRF